MPVNGALSSPAHVDPSTLHHHPLVLKAIQTHGQKRESSIARKVSNGKYTYLEDLTDAAVSKISEASKAEGNAAVNIYVPKDERLHHLIAELPQEIRGMIFKDNGFRLLHDVLVNYPFEDAMRHLAAFEEVAKIYSQRRFKLIREEIFGRSYSLDESQLKGGASSSSGSTSSVNSATDTTATDAQGNSIINNNHQHIVVNNNCNNHTINHNNINNNGCGKESQKEQTAQEDKEDPESVLLDVRA